MKQRVLVIEDDEPLADVICHNLRHEGFEVEHLTDGTTALAVAKGFSPDLVLLDLMLPGADGLALCAAWRTGSRFPIIIITARSLKEDKLRGLNAGADDYVTKPFDIEELLARIHAVLRRSRPAIDRLALGDTHIDFVSQTAFNDRGPLELTRREFEILRYLGQRPDVVVPREELLRNVWGFVDDPLTRSVDQAIVRLRRKIEPDPHHPTFIHTAHGDGYYLIPSAS